MSKKNKKEKITTRTDIVFSSLALLVEIGIGLALIMSVLFFGFKLATTCYGLFTNQFDKQAYVETLIDDIDIYVVDNEEMIENGTATNNEIITFYWLTKLNFIIVLTLMVLGLEKVRKFFEVENVDNPFTDNSLMLAKSIIKYIFIIMIVQILIGLILEIFTPFYMEFIFEIGIFEIVVIFFVYYLLRKGNEMFDKKKVKE